MKRLFILSVSVTVVLNSCGNQNVKWEENHACNKIVNVCEVKYCQEAYELDKEEYERICKRKNAFIQETGLRHTPWVTMITTEGMARGKYSQMIQSQTRLDDLFSI